MITDNEKFIEVQGILTLSDISSNDCIKINNLIIELSKENQQKEFIKYMSDIIKDLEAEDTDDEELRGYIIQRIYTFKEILRKYEEIIGDDK